MPCAGIGVERTIMMLGRLLVTQAGTGKAFYHTLERLKQGRHSCDGTNV